MVRHFYPTLFADEPALQRQAHEVAARTFELTEFLVLRMGLSDVGATFRGRVTYLASCHGFRELHLRDEPLRLLQAVRALEYVPLDGTEECCGFGGAFSMKMAELSGAMLNTKIAAIQRTGAGVVTGTDISCLMHVAGGMRRQRVPVRSLHLAEILAGEG
jgi:L-lactate dehydrogenase complex protein LldE